LIVFTKNLSRPCSRLCSDEAESVDRKSRARFLGLLVSLSGLSLVFCGSALAAAPEEPETGKAELVTNTTAVLRGIVNPKSKATVSWFFQYDEGGACTGGATTSVHSEEEVEAAAAEARVSGLQAGSEYTVCLVATNTSEETTVGKPQTFTTTAIKPAITEQVPMSVNSSEATLSAQIDSMGLPTSYKIEYGVAEPYASSSEAHLPAAEGPVGVLAHLTGLTAKAIYHFRFIAESALGRTAGAEETFATDGAGAPSASFLPDDREYELVSPSPGDQEVYVPLTPVENELGHASDVYSNYPYQASSDGAAVAFVDEATRSGSGTGHHVQGLGDQWLATRDTATGGWSAADIAQPLTSEETQYVAFSSNLSVGFVKSSVADQLAAGVPAKCRDIYARTLNPSVEVNRPLYTSNLTEQFCGAPAEPVFAGASIDATRAYFQTAAALTPGSVEAAGGLESYNLYESADEQTIAVNLLPDGDPVPDAVFGGPGLGEPGEDDLSNAISSDGSRAFWTDLETGVIYSREDQTRTLQISAGSSAAQYWTATPNGQDVFYTEGGKLYRFNYARFEASVNPEPQALEEAREVLAGEGLAHENASVHGVIGSSEDGSRLYFVAGGVLADNENGSGERATLGTCRVASEPGETNLEENVGNLQGDGCNLYVLHVGTAPRFVATLAPKDDNVPVTSASGGGQAAGDWRPDVAGRTAEVSADGAHLVFESRQRLTGYPNGGSSSAEREVEIFVYRDEGGGSLSCVSCNQTGAAPTIFAERHGGGTSIPPSRSSTVARHWMNGAGTRVLFQTSQGLVPQDTNGLQDVYEWEQTGTGTCGQAGGCVFLVSSGTSSGNSYLVDASPGGGDVFFATRAELVSGAGDQKMELYDAHQCSEAAPCVHRASLACTGTGCQGVPPAPPAFATPSSATFSGLGNFPPPTPITRKRLTAAQLNTKAFARALKACRRKRNRHTRAACENQARRRFGAPAKAKKSNTAPRAGDKHRGVR
jgi:hypothetical protein